MQSRIFAHFLSSVCAVALGQGCLAQVPGLGISPSTAPSPASTGNVVAPAPADEAQKADVGDIVVTANRQSSLASKTPISLTAFAGKDLVKNGITASDDLASRVPSLAMSTNNGGLQITIRGVTNAETTVRGDPSVAFLVDEVYYARTQEAEVALYDINRVEVLRGPQGTLFGRNTTAGMIHVITNEPDFKLSGSGDVVVGNWGTITGTAVLNAPASDTIAVRAAINYDKRDNYIYPGARFTGSFKHAKDNIGGRLSILKKWGTGSLLVRGDYTHLGGEPYNFIPAGNFYTGDAAGAPLVGVNPTYLNRSTREKLTVNAPFTWNGFRKDHTWGAEAQLNQGLGAFRVFYVGSYRHFLRKEEDPKVSFDSNSAYRLEYDGTFNQISQELRVATDRGGPLKAQIGGLYFKERIKDEFRLVQLANSPFLGQTNRTGNNPLDNTSYGFFGQATYSITPSLRFTAGARYSHDTKASPHGFTGACTQYDCATGFTLITNNIAKFESSKVTWKAGLDYDIAPKTLAFFNVSTGYKAGGFNTGCEIGTQPGCTFARTALYYQPELVTSYEGGIKSSLFDNFIRANLSGFHYDYTNIQLSQIVSNCGGGVACTVTTNGGKATVTGVELESSLFASPNDRFDLNATYLNAHFTSFVPRPGYDFAGRPLSNAPRWTVSPGYTHTFPLNDGAKIDLSVRSRISARYYLISIGTVNYYPQPGFSRTDITLGYTAPGGKWYVQGYLSNIENYVAVNYVSTGPRSGLTIDPPRTYGARAGFKF